METRDIALEALDHTPETILALGASTIPAAYLLSDYLRQFQEKNPSVRYRIRRGDSAEILEMVADGAVDLGFVGKECSREVFDSYQICQDELVVIFPNTEEYRQREKEGLNALLHSPLIIREKGSGTQNASDRVLDSLGIFQKELNIICQTNDIQMIKSLVALGFGISICSRFAVQEEERQHLFRVLPLAIDKPRHFYLVSAKNRELTPLAQKFVQVVKELTPPAV